MNSQVDIVVIGDSKLGYEAIKLLAAEQITLKFAFISREFKKSTTKDFLNVEYIKNEVIFTDYKNRLFGCYLQNGDIIFCTHLIIATGLSYEPLIVNSKEPPNVYNKVEELPKRSKDLPAVVIGQKNSDIKFALEVAKKFKHVYFCTEQFSIAGATQANLKKLKEVSNLVILPNTSIIKFNTSEGLLKSVDLSNYSTITCSAIFVKTASSPETGFVAKKLIQKNDLGYLETDLKAESTLVPKCYAIGNCCAKSNKKMFAAMIENVKKDF